MKSPGKSSRKGSTVCICCTSTQRGQSHNKEQRTKKKTLWETVPLQTTSKHTQMPKILLCSTSEILSLFTRETVLKLYNYVKMGSLRQELETFSLMGY